MTQRRRTKQQWMAILCALFVGIGIGMNLGTSCWPGRTTVCTTTTTTTAPSVVVDCDPILCHDVECNNENITGISTHALVADSTITTSDEKHDPDLEICNLSSDLEHLLNPQYRYPSQNRGGPMQTDELLLLFSLIRTSAVSRVLEIGGLSGDSARNFLEALRCQILQQRYTASDGRNQLHTAATTPVVYTVDLNPVPEQPHPLIRHKVIVMDALNLTANDIDHEPIDLLLLDCHNFAASHALLEKLVFSEPSLLSPQGFIVLHDTGLHPKGRDFIGPLIHTEYGTIHQPVERLLADYIPMIACEFQRISFHHDHRWSSRHGLTILQRRVPMYFEPQCKDYALDGKYKGGMLGQFDVPGSICEKVARHQNHLQRRCPSLPQLPPSRNDAIVNSIDDIEVPPWLVPREFRSADYPALGLLQQASQLQTSWLSSQSSTRFLPFVDECPLLSHTFYVSFTNHTTQWASSNSYAYEHRGRSMNCFLARVASDVPSSSSSSSSSSSWSSSFLSTVKLRINLSDKLFENATLNAWTLVPAASMVEMEAMQRSLHTAGNQTNTFSSITPPILLFPDSTFESWPEVHDYSLVDSTKQILIAVQHRYGWPGATEWKERRKTQLVWRGSPHGTERKELIEMSQMARNSSRGYHNDNTSTAIADPWSLLDIQAIDWNLTEHGMKLASSHELSRSDHCGYKFLLHMNGIFNNRYSSAVKWKLLCGSLVFVPTRPLFVEWYNYGKWQPFQHYIPYENSDDLVRLVAYYSLEEHWDEAATIAKAGMELAYQSLYHARSYARTFLQDYGRLTHRMVQSTCQPPATRRKNHRRALRTSTNTTKDDADESKRWNSLDELKESYGPRVCQ